MHATLIFYYKFSVSSHILIMRINMGPRKLSGPIVLGLFSVIIWKQKVLLSGELKGKVDLSKKTPTNDNLLTHKIESMYHAN